MREVSGVRARTMVAAVDAGIVPGLMKSDLELLFGVRGGVLVAPLDETPARGVGDKDVFRVPLIVPDARGGVLAETLDEIPVRGVGDKEVFRGPLVAPVVRGEPTAETLGEIPGRGVGDREVFRVLVVLAVREAGLLPFVGVSPTRGVGEEVLFPTGELLNFEVSKIGRAHV